MKKVGEGFTISYIRHENGVRRACELTHAQVRALFPEFVDDVVQAYHTLNAFSDQPLPNIYEVPLDSVVLPGYKNSLIVSRIPGFEHANEDKDKLCAFAYANSDGAPVLLFGMPHAAWEVCKSGRTHQFDLTKVGVPIKVMIFGAPTFQACMDFIKMGAQANGADYKNVSGVNLSLEPEDF